MAQVAIASGFFPAYARLPRKAQRKLDEFFRKFTVDPKQPSIHYEPVQGAEDKQLRSVRIGDDYRAIIRAPEAGDVFLMLHVDHHDEAYRWAAAKRTEIHPVTGTMQLFDVDAIAQAVTAFTDDEALSRPVAEPPGADAPDWEERRLFSDFTDEQLFEGGVPRALLPAVRAVYTEADLDRLAQHLPQEAADLLTGLAAGYAIDEVIQQILDKPQPAPGPAVTIDTTDVVAALAREGSQREFRLLDEDFDLEAALNYPLDVWRVYLHPRQRKVVRSQTKGPMRVTGAAGTGKTVVAMHRAAYLVRDVFRAPDDRVLFTTFTTNLAHDIERQLGKLLEPEQLARVEVTNLDAWASQYLRKRGKPLRLATGQHRNEAWQGAIDLYGVDGFSREFYESEWREVIQEQDIRDVDTYLRAVRRFRGARLSRAERRKLWDVFEAYRDSMQRAGVSEATEILRAARLELEQSGDPPHYRAVIVDETQDFSTEALKLVRAIAGEERPNDLFLVGDAHQRIYGRPAALSQCGINVRGRRSRELRLNYRTTAAICRWSVRTLGKGTFDDLDEGTTTLRGYTSLRSGRPPTVRFFDDIADERSFLVAEVKRLLDGGRSPEEICVVARTKNLLQSSYGPAFDKAGLSYELLEKDEPSSKAVRLATMHRVKGLEYPVVFVVGVKQGVVPLDTPQLNSDDAVVARMAELQERCLLYVASSRARDLLYVTCSGISSPFLDGLDRGPSDSPRPRSTPPHAVPAEPDPPQAVSAEPVPADPSPTQLVVREPVAPEPVPGEPVARDPAPPEPVRSKPISDPHPEPPESVESDDLEARLAKPLDQLPLPTRIFTWAQRTGAKTLADLAKVPPLTLAQERAMGRRTIAQARVVIERELGMAWEEYCRSLAGETEEATAELNETTPWRELGAALPEEVLDAQPVRLPLPARILSYCEVHGITTLRELLKVPAATLIAAPNLGRVSVNKSRQIIVDFAESAAERRVIFEDGLLTSLKAQLQELESIPRMVLTRRSGLGSQPETLESIASTLGYTRERIRQIEKKALELLARQSDWTAFVRGCFEQAAGARGVPLSEVDSGDPSSWWRGAQEKAEALDYFAERVFGDSWRVITVEEEDLLVRADPREVEAAGEACARLIRGARTPLPLADLREQCAQIYVKLPELVREALWNQTFEHLNLDERGETVVSVGKTKRAQILAVLKAAGAPVPVAELRRQVGRGSLPDEVLFLGWGLVGLKEHFPDFDAWKAKLIPEVVRVLENDGPERQWMCGEILEELREDHELPDWFGPWHLASLLRDSDQISYLGRLRVALPGVADESGRILIHEQLAKILHEHGEPMEHEALFAKLRQSTSFKEATAVLRLLRPPFLKCTPTTWGLLARDLPGGVEAMTEALDELETVLTRRERGLSAIQMQREVAKLSKVYAEWTPEMCQSITRGDTRFRISISGNVGLADWESVRVPTRAELVKRSLEEGNGRVSIEAVRDRIAAVYGSAPDRIALGLTANRFGAGLQGDWLVGGASSQSA